MDLKVAYITLNHRGGMIHYVKQLINNLPDNVHSILITGQIDDKLVKSRCYKFKLEKKYNFVEYLKIVDLINAYSPDIIHITSGHYLLMPLLRKFQNIPVVITLHDVLPHVGESTVLSNYIINKMIAVAQHIFVHGSCHKSELINKEISDKKITVIPHGEFSFFEDYFTQGIEEENAILFFGRILEYKGLNFLLDVMIELQEKFSIKLVIAGNGDLSPYLAKISQINPELIEIHNHFIPDEQVAFFFQRAKVIVLPYIEASQTGIIPIAYSFKKPVIATDVGALSEVVENGKTGFLIQPKDTEKLKSSIVTLIQNDPLRKEMGNNAYIKMKEDLSWSNVISKTILAYDVVLQE